MTARGTEIHAENQTSHIPVLMTEAVTALHPQNNYVYVDGTFGRGGYSRAILSSADCTVYSIDCDPQAVSIGKEMEKEFGNRFTILQGKFGYMDTLLAEKNISSVDGVVLDIGVSSPQFDDAQRGFSFRYDAPLDMRMSADGQTAADIINRVSEQELADILYLYGEEHSSRRIARAVIHARTEKPITRTVQFADIIRSVIPKTGKTDPATKSFQALRIAVNDELGELERGLRAAERILKPNGILAVVSFHSLEDRIVKEFMRIRSGEIPSVSRYIPSPKIAADIPSATFTLPKKSSIKPSAQEEKNNPRSRSARLRVAIRTATPFWHDNIGGGKK